MLGLKDGFNFFKLLHRFGKSMSPVTLKLFDGIIIVLDNFSFNPFATVLPTVSPTFLLLLLHISEKVMDPLRILNEKLVLVLGLFLLH
jgi:hypothetical protein